MITTYSSNFLKIKKILDKETSMMFLGALVIVIIAEVSGLASAAIPVFAANGSGQMMAIFSSVLIFSALGFIQFIIGIKFVTELVSALEDFRVTFKEATMIIVTALIYYFLWKFAFHINLVLEGVIPLTEMISTILPERLIGHYNLVDMSKVEDVVAPTYNNVRAMALNIIILYLVPTMEIVVAFFAVVESNRERVSKTSSSSTASAPAPSSGSPAPTSTTPPTPPVTPPTTAPTTPPSVSPPVAPPSNPASPTLPATVPATTSNQNRFGGLGNLLGGLRRP